MVVVVVVVQYGHKSEAKQRFGLDELLWATPGARPSHNPMAFLRQFTAAALTGSVIY
jgi:hypothetical protein